MARPKKVPPVEREPRSYEELMFQQKAAHDLYLRTGGADIDLAIESLTMTMRAFKAQTQAAEIEADNGMPHDPRRQLAWGPNVTPYEARMTGAKISTLVRQRELKMAECKALVEEAARFETKRQAEQAAMQEKTPEAEPTPEAKPAVPETRPAPPEDVAGVVKPAEAPKFEREARVHELKQHRLLEGAGV